MKLYDTQKQTKIEINKDQISLYNCGPTVYNDVHIGNTRPLVIFDVLYRVLKFTNHEVNYVHNITDIDDKIISASAKLGVSEKDLTEKYTKEYLNLFDVLNILPMKTPNVSDNMEDIIKSIESLVNNKSAYVVDGDVYFDVSKIKTYGSLSGMKLDELKVGVRVENEMNKKNPMDFCLWKKTKEGINWKSKWSNGRPGWHTECFVLINKFIGKSVSIHGGGIDLRFPHHENENAQNIALNGIDLADVWMHIGHVNIDNQKMSKSAGNFILAKDVINRDNANGFRWFYYQTKYSSPINFNNEVLTENIKIINDIIKTLNVAKTYLIANNISFNKSNLVNNDFISFLLDDLNISRAVTIIYDQIKLINTYLRSKKFNDLSSVYVMVVNELNILGIKFENIHTCCVINQINSWKKHFESKDFINADKIRSELVKKGAM